MKALFISTFFFLLVISGCKRFGGHSMDLLTLDYEDILSIKKGIREKSPEYLAAYQRLLKEADNALNRSCSSVVHKKSTPPSGDKKDYISLATYWWPDPEQADGLPYIRRDGYRNPEGNGPDYDDRRSSQMVQDVMTLTMAWFYSDEQEYANKAAEMIRVWFLDPETGMNPHLEYGQAIPGRVDGRGVGIIDTRSYIEIIDAVKVLASGKAWNQRDMHKLRQWFAAYARWLQESEHGRDERAHENNHGTWYDVQLACYAGFTGDDDMARNIISESSFQRIDRQIDSLGRQELELSRTRAYRYSMMNLHAFVLLGKMGEKYGIDLWAYISPEGGSLRKACDFIYPYMGRIEAWPYQQITPVDWSGLVPLLWECSEKFPGQGYKGMLEDLMNEIKPSDRLLITKL